MDISQTDLGGPADVILAPSKTVFKCNAFCNIIQIFAQLEICIHNAKVYRPAELFGLHHIYLGGLSRK
jgi:hypothetical protein